MNGEREGKVRGKEIAWCYVIVDVIKRNERDNDKSND